MINIGDEANGAVGINLPRCMIAFRKLLALSMSLVYIEFCKVQTHTQSKITG